MATLLLGSLRKRNISIRIQTASLNVTAGFLHLMLANGIIFVDSPYLGFELVSQRFGNLSCLTLAP